MPSIRPNCSGARRRVINRYKGRVAVTISEEMSVSRLVRPRKNTLLPTFAQMSRENNCLRLFLIRSPEFSIGYMVIRLRVLYSVSLPMYKWGKEEYLEILSKKPGLRLALKKVNPGLIDYGRFPYFRRERKYYILYLQNHFTNSSQRPGDVAISLQDE